MAKVRVFIRKTTVLNRRGTPQGGIISPTLANMALDGLQELVTLKRRYVDGQRISPMTNLVRYADDFIVTCRSKEILEQEVMPKLKEFLKVRGLTLSEEKTKITHINDGFDFPGFNFTKYKGKLLIKPSKKGIKKFTGQVAEIISLIRQHLNCPLSDFSTL
jgi:RNA-directed DNA polymerase